MTIKTLLLSGTSWLAMTVAASADPVSIGSFIISGLLSIGAGGILPAISAATLGSVVLGAGVIGLNLASTFLNSQPKVNPGDYKNTFETGDSSEIRAVGRVRVSGLKVFGNTKNDDRWRLIAHTKGRATAVEEHFIGGRSVTVEADGAVSSPPWSKKGGSFLYIRNKIGDGTETAWPQLMSEFPDLWTPDHRVRGIAQSLVNYESPGLADPLFLKLYQSGEPPYERVQRSEPIFDPRSGAQSPTNPATWLYRDNGPLCAAHILRSYPSLKASDLDYVDIAAEATKAEIMLPSKTGTVQRSRCWGMWPAENPRGDVMKQVLESIGAEIVPTSDNTYSIRLVDDVRTPEITLTARDIIDLQWRSGPESVERPNVCRVNYYSPERNYEMAEIDMTGIAWARVQSEIDRVGEQIYDVTLPFCPNASQAQRIARRLFALARADAGIVTTNFVGIAAWGLTVASVELPDLDVTEVCAIGTPRVDDDQGTVEIPFIVWPTLSPWNPATDEAAAPDPIPEMQFESNLDTPVAPTGYGHVIYPNGTHETRISFTPVADADDAEATYRTYVAGEPNEWSAMTATGLAVAYIPGNFEGLKADFRVRFFDDEDEGSYWSPTLMVPSIAIDNNAPPAPTLSVVKTDIYSISVGTSALNAASAKIQRFVSGVWADIATGHVRPGSPFTTTVPVPGNGGSSDITVQFRSFVYSSNGTVSPVSNGYSDTIPGTGGG